MFDSSFSPCSCVCVYLSLDVCDYTGGNVRAFGCVNLWRSEVDSTLLLFHLRQSLHQTQSSQIELISLASLFRVPPGPSSKGGITWHFCGLWGSELQPCEASTLNTRLSPYPFWTFRPVLFTLWWSPGKVFQTEACSGRRVERDGFNSCSFCPSLQWVRNQSSES